MNAIEKLTLLLPRDAGVLDVGSGGLTGENTTDYLVKHFTDITGICTEDTQYQLAHPEVRIIFADFYTYPFRRKFDLIVSDLDIEQNLNDWSQHQSFPLGLLKSGGHLITYLMTTDQYGDPDVTPALIRQHWKDFWGGWPPQREKIGKKLEDFPNFEFILAEQEERRPYITWILLKRKQAVFLDEEP